MSAAAPPPPPPKERGVPSPTVDLVLVFQSSAPASAKKKPTADDASQRTHEFKRLVAALQAVGLRTTARDGKPGSGQVLLFVKATDSLLVEAGQAESLNDYVHGLPSSLAGGSSSSASSKPASQAQAQTFSAAQRIRLVHSLVTSPPTARGLAGAGVLPKSHDYPHLVDMTPIHDLDYNRQWLAAWSGGKSAKIFIGDSELDSVRAHFGEHIALYFGFLSFYFKALFVPSAFGFAYWYRGAPLHPIYSLLLVLWACVFVEVWRLRERALAVRWGTLGIQATDERRKEFTPRTRKRDDVTGEQVEVFEWWRREIRIATSIPVMLFFAALLGATLTTMFATEVFVSKLYQGPGKAIVPQIPTIIFVAIVPQIMGAWQSTATALTGWENHYSARSHNFSQTLKMFALQGFVSYGALSLSAFVYIPFGQAIMDAVVSRGFFRDSIADAAKRGDISLRKDGGVVFDINPSRMSNQLFAVLTTSQVIGAFTELVLPLVMRKVNAWRASKKAAKEKRTASSSGSSDEARFLDRVRDELELPPYELFGDYAEMATQFGFIALWSVIWPLAPVMGWVNNFFELRSDAAKVCLNSRRPVPVRTDSVGPWLEVLGFIAWLSAMSNTALVYLFQPSPEAHLPGHSVYETTMRSHLHPTFGGGGNGAAGITPSSLINGTKTAGDVLDSMLYPSDPTNSPRSPLSFSNLLPSWLPSSGPVGALVAALLLSLMAEHLYGVARAGIRHVLERAMWKGSEAETVLRRREWESRAEGVRRAKAMIKVGSGTAAETTHESETDASFWSKEADVGVQSVGQVGKTE